MGSDLLGDLEYVTLKDGRSQYYNLQVPPRYKNTRYSYLPIPFFGTEYYIAALYTHSYAQKLTGTRGSSTGLAEIARSDAMQQRTKYRPSIRQPKRVVSIMGWEGSNLPLYGPVFVEQWPSFQVR